MIIVTHRRSFLEPLLPIRIRQSVPLTNGSDPDPAIFVSDLQDAFPLLHLHHFSKIKSCKEVTKQKESRIILLFFLEDSRI
jgi:hypothetical protein